MGIITQSLRNDQTKSRQCLWFMRQAGRYLPEYRDIRHKAGSFLDLCYTPELAAEVTLQPVERFDVDAAILFSDILVIPNALGIDVSFKEGVGPILKRPAFDELPDYLAAIQENTNLDILNPIYETVKRVKAKLRSDQDMIGFCGAPWTVLLYMLEEKPSKGCEQTRMLAYHEPELFEALLEILVKASTQYLIRQVAAGATALQLFESWALHVPHDLFDVAVKQPLRKIYTEVKKIYPNIPIILFPRGLAPEKLKNLAETSDDLYQGLGIDYTVDPIWARDHLQPHICLQGNMDPALLLTTPDLVREKVTTILDTLGQRSNFIFNLGHGIMPQAKIACVEAMVTTVKEYHR